MVKDELDAGRPLQYRGSTGSGGGHSFVCDGYDSNNKFHFNWGWAGSYDGYFYLSNLNTGANTQTGAGNGDYTNDQAAIFGIQPATIGEAAAPTLTATLVQSTGIRNANLSWTAVSDAASYQLYYDCQLIYSGTETSFTHEHIPYGTSTYFVRSVDDSGNLSWPSNYASISITFPGPANLTSVQSENGIQLSWDAADNAVSYNIFCNGILFANTTSTSYLDDRAIAGELKYFLKGVDALGDESDASEIATVNVAYSAPIVNSLSATLTNNNATLTWTAPDWCYPETSSATLTYGIGTFSSNNILGYQGTANMYWGHRYLASNLSALSGMVIYKLSFYSCLPGQYEYFMYKGTNTQNSKVYPNDQLAHGSFIVSEDGWFEIALEERIEIDDSQDLWVFIYDPEAKNYPATFCKFTGNTEGCYYSSSNPLSTIPNTYSGVAWLIRTFLTDGTYTYNLYQDGTPIAQNLTETTYNATLNDDAANLFTVKTKFYGGETAASNMAGLAKGTTSLAKLEMVGNDQMTVTEGSTLTVTGTLSNDKAENLVIENGAQLIHNTTGVKATVNKTIAPYTTDEDGWNFIASPVTEAITPTEENGLLANEYDLYYYDEPAHYWRNHKGESETSGFGLTYKQGYLYANDNQTTLQFAGTLTPSNAAVSSNTLSYNLKGFNLIGNPFACNATLGTTDFYIIDSETHQVTLAETGRQIGSCEGVFVQASEACQTVSFSKASASKGETTSAVLDLVVAQGRSTLDRARVRLGEGTNMEKFTLDGNESTQLAFWQEGQDYAVAYMGTDAAGHVSTELPLNFKAAENGTYSIGIETNSLNLDHLHLIDNMTGDDVDLLAKTSYTFEAKTTDYASRFRLVFAADDASTGSASDATFAYVSNGEIVVVGNAVGDAGTASLQVVDMTGRVIRTVGLSQCGSRTTTAAMPAGVYILRLIDSDNVRTQKIVIE
ncbi:MAG: C10 family peptidase [Bacteroidales bacterium]|nr:C10 family peptidase [Bacteroidales bacterium]